jgi:hypothetical protein
VESNGSLFVVEMYFRRTGVNTSEIVLDTSVLKVDEESSRWLRVTDLGDVLFVLGKDLNFSLSANDYYGFERNCIYCSALGRIACFSLNYSKFKFLDDIDWPCPTLFNSDLFL